MVDHDGLFKKLLGTFFVEFVELFFPDLAGKLERDSLVFLEKELLPELTEGEKVEADLVIKARLQGAESFFLVHLENQAKTQPEFGFRMFRYFARLHEKHRLPVYPIAVFSFDKPKRAEKHLYRVAFPEFSVLTFHFRVVQLNRLDWRSYLNNPNPVAAALMAKMGIARAERVRVKLECLRMLATLRLDPVRMQLISGFVDTYLRLSAAEESRFLEEVATIVPAEREQVMEIVTSWMQKGLEQGRREGRQEGRVEGALDIVKRQLVQQVGALTPALEREIEALDVATLERLGVALLKFGGPQDLQRWLAKATRN